MGSGNDHGAIFIGAEGRVYFRLCLEVSFFLALVSPASARGANPGILAHLELRNGIVAVRRPDIGSGEGYRGERKRASHALTSP